MATNKVTFFKQVLHIDNLCLELCIIRAIYTNIMVETLLSTILFVFHLSVLSSMTLRIFDCKQQIAPVRYPSQ